MSAEIIQFGGSAKAALKRFKSPRQRRPSVREAVKCMSGEEQYLVEFSEGTAEYIYTFHYRVKNGNGKAEEVKRRRWSRERGYSRFNDEKAYAIVAAARRVMTGGGANNTDHRENAIAGLRRRRAKLAHQI
jgi:hypothetical protein